MKSLLLGPLLLAGCLDVRLDTASSSLIGGQLAGANEFPTVVALEQGPGNFFCTGTLIDPNWVLTAAHCVQGAPPGAVKIRLDDLDVNDGKGGARRGGHRHPKPPRFWRHLG